MGTTVHRLASHTKHLHNQLRMKAFVAAVASLAASANSQVLVNPYLSGLAGAPLTTVAAAPGPYVVPALGSQFKSQDEFGNTAYGYGNLHSAKHEVGNPLVGVSGGYSYVDTNGKLQTTSYVADGLGFRVEATNLPVAPVYEGKAPVFNPELPVAPVYTGVAPVAPEPTPEVAAATAAHAAAVAEVNAREKRSTPASTKILEIKPVEVKALPLTYGAYGYGGLYSGSYAPLGYGLHYGGAPFAPLGYNPLLAAPLKTVVA